MAFISHIIKKACQDVGVLDTRANSIPPDMLKTAHALLKDVVAELNTQTAISFGQQEDAVQVVSNKLTFKPYTEAEQAIIDGGGTVDITDRLVDFIPLTTPIVYNDQTQLNFVSYKDLKSISLCGGGLSSYTFNVKSDCSELIFDSVGGALTILRNIPIILDEEPFGEVYIPDAYTHFLTSKLSESVAIRYQFTDMVGVFSSKSSQSGNVLANNNESHKPIKQNLKVAYNRFRKYS